MPQRPPSTESPFAHLTTADFAEASEEQLEMVASSLGLPSAHPAAITAALGDPRRVDALLAGLNPVALLALEVLVTHGGELAGRALVGLTRDALSFVVPCDPSAVVVGTAVSDLFAEGLCVDADWGDDSHGYTPATATLSAPVAARVAESVYGISLPERPKQMPGASCSDELIEERRHLVMVAAQLAQQHIRANKDDSANAANVRRLAGTWDVEPTRLGRTLNLATQLGLLEVRGGHLRPRLPALLAAATGGLFRGDYDQELAEIVSEEWVSAEAVVRCLVAMRWFGTSPAYHHSARALQVRHTAVARELAEEPGLQHHTVGSDVWVRRATVASPAATGDGHVTSSFEIMLGPDASLPLLTRLGLCARLQRLDRVLVLRLSPESVAIGVAAGLAREQILADLQAVADRPAPANVVALVEDWLDNAALATGRRAWLVEVPVAKEAQVCKALGPRLVQRLAEGRLAIDFRITEAELDKILASAGVIYAGVAAYPDETEDQRRDLDKVLQATQRRHRQFGLERAWELGPALPVDPTPDGKLRRRLWKAAKRGFAKELALAEKALRVIQEAEAAGADTVCVRPPVLPPPEKFEPMSPAVVYRNFQVALEKGTWLAVQERRGGETVIWEGLVERLLGRFPKSTAFVQEGTTGIGRVVQLSQVRSVMVALPLEDDPVYTN